MKAALEAERLEVARREAERVEVARREAEHRAPQVYYENCNAVRAAGAAPIRRGQPGYSRRLDRDGDGEGCGSD